MADNPPQSSTQSPRIVLLSFASLRTHPNQELYARGIPRMLAWDLNRGEPGAAAAGLLTSRRRDVKGYVLPQAPSEPGPLAALGEALGVQWIVQGFSNIGEDDVDLQIQLVDAKSAQVTDVKRFSGDRADLGKLIDQVRAAIAATAGVKRAPSMPPPVWSQTRDKEAFEAFLLYLDNSILLYDPADQPFVGELRDPADCLREALKHDRFFRTAADCLAQEDKSVQNSFGTVLEIDVDASALL